MSDKTPQTRCHWPKSDHSILYHDQEWGVPLHDDSTLFEYMILDAAQAGLSWETILRKREGYRRAYGGFDPAKVARFGEKQVAKLLADPGIVRNRLKIASSITNAQAFLKVQAEFGSFDAFIWQFVDGKPLVNTWKEMSQIPAQSAQSQAMSKDLLSRGFRFVGPTICYAFMQAAGMVNDHLVSCFRHGAVGKAKRI
ncbi:MAG: DNA-3-methyladenine glycosylase I [Tepidisphaeraceae bacterium]|jgi:DNA-3-methyladenine glycosylase I